MVTNNDNGKDDIKPTCIKPLKFDAFRIEDNGKPVDPMLIVERLIKERGWELVQVDKSGLKALKKVFIVSVIDALKIETEPRSTYSASL